MHLEWFILGSTSHRQSGRRREGERGRGREREMGKVQVRSVKDDYSNAVKCTAINASTDFTVLTNFVINQTETFILK